MQTLSRIRRMTLAEIACRGRQETSKWLERVTSPAPGASRHVQRLEAAAHALARFQAHNAPRLFDPAVAPVLASRWPDRVAEVLAAAEGICEGRFALLGYDDVRFGAEIDWHLDPIHARRAPDRHWSQIDPLDPGAVGDSKIIWELNRHQWLVTLAQAYLLTHDDRYVRHGGALVESWLAANPRGRGINWSSSLEVAYRLIAWSWALAMLQGTAAAGHLPLARMAWSIREHALHVERYLSHYFSPNTHLTGEALGLLYAGVLFDGFSEARRWRETGRRVLVEESERQILSDGVYFEQATCYHRYTIEIYLHALLLGDRFQLGLPAALATRVERMFDLLARTAQADGSMPDVGDADGGWLLPFVRRRPLDCRGVFAWGAAWFGRADLAWQANGDGADAVWALGPRGLSALDALQPAPPDTPASKAFAASGCVVMRSGWEREANGLLFDAGPLGCPVSAAHGHADLLSIQCWAFGEAWIVDAGTGCYTPDRSWRTYFRGTAAHNCVRVDGLDQAEPAGPFSWRTRPSGRLRSWTSGPAYDVADADHDGYRRLADPVRHRRRVLFLKPDRWVIVDDLEGVEVHELEWRFHVTADPAIEAGGAARLRRGDKSFWIVPAAGVTLTPAVETEWRSPAYGRREAAPVLVYRARVRLPVRAVFVLAAAAGRYAARPAIERIESGVTGHDGIGMPDRGERIGIDPHVLTIEATPCAAS